jgi:hypothetical protein
MLRFKGRIGSGKEIWLTETNRRLWAGDVHHTSTEQAISDTFRQVIDHTHEWGMTFLYDWYGHSGRDGTMGFPCRHTDGSLLESECFAIRGHDAEQAVRELLTGSHNHDDGMR